MLRLRQLSKLSRVQKGHLFVHTGLGDLQAYASIISFLNAGSQTGILVEGIGDLVMVQGRLRGSLPAICHLFLEFLHPDTIHELVDLVGELHVLFVEHGEVILLGLVDQGELL